MTDLNQIITKNFQENIFYLEKNHKLVFDKVVSLENAIKNEYYQEKYELIFDNDGFDVKEIDSEYTLYQKESLAHTLVSTNSVNFRTDNYTIEGFIKHTFLESKQTQLNTDTDPFESKKYINSLLHALPFQEQKELKNIHKFIFFGIGLGLHITQIDKKIASNSYFIVEDDLELFRLSLFCTNYLELSHRANLFFSVFESQDEFMSSASSFLENEYYYNHYLKFFHLQHQKEDSIERFQQAVSSQPHVRFLFTDLLRQVTQPLKYLSKNFSFLQNSLSFSNEKMKKTPVLLLASGPSLQTEIQWLKENHQKFLTVAVSSSLAFLQTHQITPNLIIHMDPFEQSIISFKKLKSLDFIQESLLFFSASTPQSITQLFKAENICFFETATNYKQDSFKTLAPCVGSTAYQLLLLLQTPKLYLLGLDLAVDSKDGATHAGEHQDKENLYKDEQTHDYKKSLLPVEGNFMKEVYTTPDFYTSLFAINQIGEYLKKDSQETYNLSNGARLLHTHALETKNLTTTLFEETTLNFEEVKKQIQKHTTSNCTQDETTHIQKQLQHAKRLKTKLLEFELQNLKTIQEYLNLFICNTISDKDLESYKLSTILDSYYHYIFSYILNAFDDNKTLEFQSILPIHKLLLANTVAIIDYYIDSLQKV